MSRRISQREARRSRARVNELEKLLRDTKRGWLQDWPDAKHIFTVEKGEGLAVEELEMVRVARMLGHPVVVARHGDALHFYGVDL